MADGFNLMPPVLPEMLDVFIAEVVPILQRRGLFRTAYEGRRCARTSDCNAPPHRHAARTTTMTLARRRFIGLAAAAAATASAPRGGLWTELSWESFPDRPVRIIVPYAPGGPTDTIARLMAQKISERVGRQFFVENVGGACG